MTERCKCGTDAMGGCRIHNRAVFEMQEAVIRADQTRRIAEMLRWGWDNDILPEEAVICADFIEREFGEADGE